MKYFDKNGIEIKGGMSIRLCDGSIERIYDTTGYNGEPDLGINASNEDYLRRHPDAVREFYPLSFLNTQETVIVDQKVRT